MKPRFNVGEEVILQSKDYPEMNGEYTVLKVISGGGMVVCSITGQSYRQTDGLSYVLNDGNLHKRDNCEINWNESALRKKHKPSGKSFSEMMSDIKNKELENV